MAMQMVGTRLVTSIVLCVLALPAPERAVAQATLFPDVATSNPPTGATDIPVNRGKKGLLFRFKYWSSPGIESPTGFPMNLTSAVVSLKVGTNAALTCTNGTTAPANACVFTAHDGDTMDGVLDYVKVIYGSDFPLAVTVEYSVAGARSSAATGGIVQDAATNNLVSFTTSTTPPLTRPKGIAELVLDISGSMSARVKAGGSRTRWQLLVATVDQFFSLLPAAVIEGDQIGAVYFATTATASSPAAFAAHLDAQRLLLLNDIKSKGPTSATSIGDGLKKALPALTGGGSPPRKVVLLFSDGEQNTPPCVGLPNNACWTSTVDGSSLIVDGTPYTAAEVCPVMVGQMTAPGWILQQRIGQIACGNNSLKIEDAMSEDFAADDFSTFFAQILTKVFPGDKLEIARSVSDTLPSGVVTTEKFFAGARDIGMTITVSWGGMSRIPFGLKAPNGTVIDLTRYFDFRPGATTVRLKLPIVQNGVVIPTQGEWELAFRGDVRGPFRYHALVLLDNEVFDSDFRVTSTDVGTGDPITVEARLREGGMPVTGGTVAIQVSGPQQGLGQMLATAPNPPGSPPGAATDPFNDPAAAKVAKLKNDPAFASLFASQALPSMTLRDDGLGGDVTANDGIYTARLGATNVEGHYRFEFAARATTARSGTVQRSWKTTLFVRAKADANNTTMVVLSSTPQSAGVLHLVRVTPKDKFGSMLGPGYIGALRIVPAPPSTVVGPVVDNLNGTYDVRILVPTTQVNPPITVVVLGTPVFTRPLAPTSTGRFFSLHAGTAIPQSTLSNVFAPSISLGADVELKLQRIFSIEAFLGYDTFKSDASGVDNLTLGSASLSGKATFGEGALRPAVEAGAGAYFASGSGEGTHFGWSAAASLQYWMVPRRALDVSYRFRSTRGGDWQYSTLQAGVRLGF